MVLMSYHVHLKVICRDRCVPLLGAPESKRRGAGCVEWTLPKGSSFSPNLSSAAGRQSKSEIEHNHRFSITSLRGKDDFLTW